MHVSTQQTPVVVEGSSTSLSCQCSCQDGAGTAALGSGACESAVTVTRTPALSAPGQAPKRASPRAGTVRAGLDTCVPGIRFTVLHAQSVPVESVNYFIKSKEERKGSAHAVLGRKAWEGRHPEGVRAKEGEASGGEQPRRDVSL